MTTGKVFGRSERHGHVPAVFTDESGGFKEWTDKPNRDLCLDIGVQLRRRLRDEDIKSSFCISPAQAA